MGLLDDTEDETEIEIQTKTINSIKNKMSSSKKKKD